MQLIGFDCLFIALFSSFCLFRAPTVSNSAGFSAFCTSNRHPLISFKKCFFSKSTYPHLLPTHAFCWEFLRWILDFSLLCMRFYTSQKIDVSELLQCCKVSSCCSKTNLTIVRLLTFYNMLTDKQLACYRPGKFISKKLK